MQIILLLLISFDKELTVFRMNAWKITKQCRAITIGSNAPKDHWLCIWLQNFTMIKKISRH